jgi:hypothetical protein
MVRDLLVLLRSNELETDRTALSTGSELIAEVESVEVSLAGDPAAAEDLALHFAPTGVLQEVAVSSGFHDEYMQLASRHDKVATRYPWTDQLRATCARAVPGRFSPRTSATNSRTSPSRRSVISESRAKNFSWSSSSPMPSKKARSKRRSARPES